MIDEKEREAMILTWEREFDELNKDPEENSDFDSDNEVNPLDTLVPAGTEYMPTPSITSENKRKRRPIQVSVIGRPNVGKSTLINSLLKEYRVVASDLPGTTRDSVLIEWAFKGRRIHLVDTAGLRPPRCLLRLSEQAGQACTRRMRTAHTRRAA